MNEYEVTYFNGKEIVKENVKGSGFFQGKSTAGIFADKGDDVQGENVVFSVLMERFVSCKRVRTE